MLVLPIQSARNEAAFALERLQETGLEIKSLRAMSQRMILTKEEMVCANYYNSHLFSFVLYRADPGTTPWGLQPPPFM